MVTKDRDTFIHASRLLLHAAQRLHSYACDDEAFNDEPVTGVAAWEALVQLANIFDIADDDISPAIDPEAAMLQMRMALVPGSLTWQMANSLIRGELQKLLPLVVKGEELRQKFLRGLASSVGHVS